VREQNRSRPSFVQIVNNDEQVPDLLGLVEIGLRTVPMRSRWLWIVPR
jgi:hypothetical protein